MRLGATAVLFYPFAMHESTSGHIPVMSAEVLSSLEPHVGQIIVDGTLGGGGHTQLIAERVGPDGLVIAIDRDHAAVVAARDRFGELSKNDRAPVRAMQGNYCDLPELLASLDITAVDAVLLDLGLSSDQLADEDRGFSFHAEGPLDLRFDTARGEPAWRLVNRLSAQHLADLLYRYGEERHSRRVARRIVERRRDEPIRTARQFADIVRAALPRDPRQRIDPATRSFQALRIAVNDELKSLEIALRRLPTCVRPGGAVAIISFHSLEDRLVKNAFRDNDRYEVITRKPLRPSPTEIAQNPRSRSARFRVARVTDSTE